MTGSSDEGEFLSTIQRKPIKVVAESAISSVALLANGQQFVSGDRNGKIRRWRMEGVEEVGTPINAESAVCCLATSQDGKWIAAGTAAGRVTVWDAKSRKEMSRFELREKAVNSVDVSSDGTKFAVAWDGFVNVYSLPGGKKLCSWKDCDFHMVKFSPDELFLAIGGEDGRSFYWIKDTRNGKLLSGAQISIRSVAWAGDSKKLFALSSDGNIHCVDVSSGNLLSKWSIHSTNSPKCIALSGNGAFIAASANSSVSFWDTSKHQRIGFVIHHPCSVNSMAISPNYDLLIAGNSTIALWDLLDVFSTLNKQVSDSSIFGLYS